MFGSFLPSLGCLAAIKSTQVEGADIVMKSRGVARRSEPSIDPESLLHDHYLQTLSCQVGIAALGQSASFNHSTTRPRELAEGIGQKARAGKPDTIQDQTGDRPGVQSTASGSDFSLVRRRPIPS